MPQLVAYLLDATIPAFWDGAILKDDHGTMIHAWEDVVPALIELPADAHSCTLQVGLERYTQSLARLGEH